MKLLSCVMVMVGGALTLDLCAGPRRFGFKLENAEVAAGSSLGQSADIVAKHTLTVLPVAPKVAPLVPVTPKSPQQLPKSPQQAPKVPQLFPRSPRSEGPEETQGVSWVGDKVITKALMQKFKSLPDQELKLKLQNIVREMLVVQSDVFTESNLQRQITKMKAIAGIHGQIQLMYYPYSQNPLFFGPGETIEVLDTTYELVRSFTLDVFNTFFEVTFENSSVCLEYYDWLKVRVVPLIIKILEDQYRDIQDDFNSKKEKFLEDWRTQRLDPLAKKLAQEKDQKTSQLQKEKQHSTLITAFNVLAPVALLTTVATKGYSLGGGAAKVVLFGAFVPGVTRGLTKIASISQKLAQVDVDQQKEKLSLPNVQVYYAAFGLRPDDQRWASQLQSIKNNFLVSLEQWKQQDMQRLQDILKEQDFFGESDEQSLAERMQAISQPQGSVGRLAGWWGAVAQVFTRDKAKKSGAVAIESGSDDDELFD